MPILAFIAILVHFEKNSNIVNFVLAVPLEMNKSNKICELWNKIFLYPLTYNI